jgi:hypothetical protein
VEDEYDDEEELDADDTRIAKAKQRLSNVKSQMSQRLDNIADDLG